MVHYSHLYQVLEYLYHIRDLKLKISTSDNIVLEGFADADFGGTVCSKSISGYYIKSYGNLTIWKSKKQTVVALSITEVLILSLCSAICEILHLTHQ